MVFYVNVPHTTKVNYEDGESSVKLGQYVKTNANFIDDVGNSVKKTLIQQVSPGHPSGNYSSIASSIKDKVNAKLSGAAATSSLGTILRQDKSSRKQNNMSGRMNLTKRISDSVTLYLPPNIQDNLNAQYNAMATGLAGAALAGGVAAADAYNEDDFEKSIKSGLNVASAATGNAAARVGAELIESLTGAEGARESFLKVKGVADNPYMEVLFDKVGLREFNYNFQFAPKNPDETEDIKKIINLFRFHMLPELRGNAARFLKLPSEFDIHYMYMGEDGAATENHYYNKIATCVLQNLSVDYTPNGVKSFSNGAPTQINLTLSFKETEMMTKEMVNDGF